MLTGKLSGVPNRTLGNRIAPGEFSVKTAKAPVVSVVTRAAISFE
jgi:hypothetical protein